jgi:hypothetical protein
MRENSNSGTGDRRRAYTPPKVHDFFDPKLLVVAAVYADASCLAPPKMPPK